MSTKGKKKAAVLTPEETAAQEAFDKFVKTHEGKTLTASQKEQKAELAQALGSLKFVRIANKRVPRARAAIKGIGNLAGKAYAKSAAQVKAICDALEGDVKQLRAELSGVKATDDFKLPGFNEVVEGEEKE